MVDKLEKVSTIHDCIIYCAVLEREDVRKKGN